MIDRDDPLFRGTSAARWCGLRDVTPMQYAAAVLGLAWCLGVTAFAVIAAGAAPGDGAARTLLFVAIVCAGAVAVGFAVTTVVHPVAAVLRRAVSGVLVISLAIVIASAFAVVRDADASLIAGILPLVAVLEVVLLRRIASVAD